MADSSLGALLRAVVARLKGTSADVWADRVYVDEVPSGIVRPYVLIQYAAGGEANLVLNRDPEHTLTIRCTANDFAITQAADARIDTLLNDADYETAKALDGGTSWLILNCTRREMFHLAERVDGALIYHDGARYTFRMEAK